MKNQNFTINAEDIRIESIYSTGWIRREIGTVITHMPTGESVRLVDPSIRGSALRLKAMDELRIKVRDYTKRPDRIYYVAYKKGFIGEEAPVVDIRMAKPFESFDEADAFAKRHNLKYFAVLRGA